MRNVYQLAGVAGIYRTGSPTSRTGPSALLDGWRQRSMLAPGVSALALGTYPWALSMPAPRPRCTMHPPGGKILSTVTAGVAPVGCQSAHCWYSSHCSRCAASYGHLLGRRSTSEPFCGRYMSVSESAALAALCTGPVEHELELGDHTASVGHGRLFMWMSRRLCTVGARLVDICEAQARTITPQNLDFALTGLCST